MDLLPPPLLAMLLPMLGFTLAASVTPGPNTLMVTALAARLGWRRAVPACLGVALGFMALLLVLVLGLAGPMATWPALQSALRWVGAAWLLWLAWRIAAAPPPGPEAAAGRGGAPGFWAAAALQWVNPKAWTIGLAGLATFTDPEVPPWHSGLCLVLVFGLVVLPSLAVWVGIGLGAGRLLHTPRAWRRFNIAMGLLLAASILPLLR